MSAEGWQGWQGWQGWRKETRIPGAITWHGYVVRCGQCGSHEGPWTLIVAQGAWTVGRDAFLKCLNEHRVDNPVISPGIGLRLIGAADVMAELDRLNRDPDSGWIPMIRHHTTAEDKWGYQHSDMPSDWIDFSPGLDSYFEREWPELYAAMVNAGAGRSKG